MWKWSVGVESERSNFLLQNQFRLFWVLFFFCVVFVWFCFWENLKAHLHPPRLCEIPFAGNITKSSGTDLFISSVTDTVSQLLLKVDVTNVMFWQTWPTRGSVKSYCQCPYMRWLLIFYPSSLLAGIRLNGWSLSSHPDLGGSILTKPIGAPVLDDAAQPLPALDCLPFTSSDEEGKLI